MKYWLIALTFLVSTNTAVAQGSSKIAYYGIEPDIVTNYINNKKKLGYVRLTIELMLMDGGDMDLVEHHAPLLRDALVEILGRESEQQIKSLVGREEVRKKCLAKLQELLQQETGKEVLKDIIFTKYLYH